MRHTLKINEKTVLQKITYHKKGLLRKKILAVRKSNYQKNDIGIIFSGHSTSNLARALKMRNPRRNPKCDKAFQR